MRKRQLAWIGSVLVGAALLTGTQITTAAAAVQTTSETAATAAVAGWRPTYQYYPSWASCDRAGQAAFENDDKVGAWKCPKENGRYHLILYVG